MKMNTKQAAAAAAKHYVHQFSILFFTCSHLKQKKKQRNSILNIYVTGKAWDKIVFITWIDEGKQNHDQSTRRFGTIYFEKKK